MERELVISSPMHELFYLDLNLRSSDFHLLFRLLVLISILQNESVSLDLCVENGVLPISKISLNESLRICKLWLDCIRTLQICRSNPSQFLFLNLESFLQLFPVFSFLRRPHARDQICPERIPALSSLFFLVFFDLLFFLNCWWFFIFIPSNRFWTLMPLVREWLLLNEL